MSIDTTDRRAFKFHDLNQFETLGQQLITKIAAHLELSLSGEYPVALPKATPDECLAQWDGNFTTSPDPDYDFLGTIDTIIDQSNHLHHKRYIGHQVSPPLPLASLSDLLSSVLNNGTAIYEMGPVNTMMEKRLTDWMARLIGYDVDQTGGVLTSGGSIGNLTAMLAMRQAKAGYNLWQDGHKVDADHPRMAVLVSEEAHYCVKRALQIMGWGEDSVILVPTNERFKMRTDLLAELTEQANQKGFRVSCVIGSACSTATGSYDDLNAIADFCEANELWFHVDGAHGASALISENKKQVLSGINRADSVVWDAHKMLLMPALITGVIFKNKQHGNEAFLQKASYIFENTVDEEWYNLGHRTLECTKLMMGMKFYLALKMYGTQFFADYIDHTYTMASRFATIVEKAPDFERAIEHHDPEANILCYRYIGDGSISTDGLNALNAKLRRAVIETERFYIVQSKLKGIQYLRSTVMNPETTEDDFKELLDLIRSKAKLLTPSMAV